MGSVITTTRDAQRTLASKYFHRTKRSLRADVQSLANEKSSAARLWFFHWHDYDPCEQLRYYDGIPGCNLADIPSRAADIAARMDCVVDTDDPEPDLKVLCAEMRIEECPPFPRKNVKGDGYEMLFDAEHVGEALRRVLWVTKLLRKELRGRLCRDFDGVGIKGFGRARFPYKGCGND